MKVPPPPPVILRKVFKTLHLASDLGPISHHFAPKSAQSLHNKGLGAVVGGTFVMVQWA